MKYVCDTVELRLTKEDFKTLFSNIVAIYRFNR